MTEREYDFSNKNPDEALTDDEIDHFSEGMKLKNTSEPSMEFTELFGAAVKSTAKELDKLFA
jgi:hypothetical protein